MKELLIFLGGMMCGGFIATVILCVITVGNSKKRRNMEDEYLAQREKYIRK